MAKSASKQITQKILADSMLTIQRHTRTQSVAETLSSLLPLTGQIGITRLADITGLDCLGIPTILAIRPNAKHLSVSVGKGVSLEIAKVSAIMESMELYHLENPPAPITHSSYKNLQEDAISPTTFAPGFFNHLHLENACLPWTQGINLLDQHSYLVPHDLINLDSTGVRENLAWFDVSTNGVAAGSSIDEAICHSLYEIIERESLQRWKNLSHIEKKQTLISPKKINTPISAYLLEKFFSQHFNIKIWEITNSLGIPVFHCAVSDNNPFRLQGIFRGSGAHLSQDIALARALTEVAQSRLSIIAGSRDDIFPEKYRQLVEVGDVNLPVETYISQMRSHPLTSVRETKNTLLQCLRAAGFEKILFINHTKTTVNVPVVQIIIPGIQAIH